MEHARRFFIKGDRVKATVVFRGREITHLDFGQEILQRLNGCLEDLAQIEVAAKMEGRNMISIYVPDKLKIKEAVRKMELERKRTGTVAPELAPLEDEDESEEN